MAENFEYSREWTDAEAFPLLGFTRNWEDPNDYPTVEMDEMQVRKDMQSLHDEVKDYINNTLIPAVLAADATEAARAAAEEARDTAEGLRAKDEQARNSAETDRELNESNRIEQENGRVAAEKARADETTGIVARASRSEDNAEAWAQGGYVSEEDEDGMIQDTPVPGAKWYAEKAAACANGGSYDPDPTDGTAERTYTSGAKNMADKARAFAQGGSYKEYQANTGAPGTFTLVTETVPATESAKGYAEKAAQAAIRQPIIKGGTWWVWNSDSGAYTDTGVSAGGTGGGTSDQVFIAEYDVTTNAELLAAYQSGKICFVKYNDQYVPVTIVQADYSSNFTLKGYIIIAESVPGVYVNAVEQTVIVCRYDTGWSVGTRTLSVDDALSETSENPVQNKVIKSALDAKPNVDNQYSALYMLSPNGTVYKVKISDAGELYVDGVADDETLDDLLPGRILAWNDEFNSELSDVWAHEIGYVRNNELQYYTDDPANCYISDSILHLVALKNSPADGHDWSSASIITRQKYAFYRGLIEAKMKITPNVGVWPAFWAKGDSYYCTFNPLTSLGEKWPRCAEVDVCELVGDSPFMRSGIFWYNDLLESQKTTNIGTKVSVDDDWHIYGWERTDTAFNFYFDRTLIGSIDISALPYAEELLRAMYIQFNVAVGGDVVENPDASLNESSCLVDWVRAYLPEGATSIAKPTLSLDCGDSFVLNPSKIRYLRPVWSSDAGNNYAVEWSSDNVSVATVYGGKVTAITDGTANISAKDANGNIVTAQLTVDSDAVNLVENIVIKNVPDALNYGDSIKLSAYIEPDYATDKSVTWTSSDPSIATMDGGVVTAISMDGGTVTITCSSVDGGASASVSIKCNSAVIVDNIDTTNVLAKYTRNGMSTDRTWSDDTGNCDTFDFANMSYDTNYKIYYDSPYGYYGKTASGTRTQSIKPTNYFVVCDTPDTFTLFFVFYYNGVSNSANQCLGCFTDGSSTFSGLIPLCNGSVNFVPGSTNVLSINNGYNYAAITYDGNTVTVYVNSLDNTDSRSKQRQSKIALTGYGQAFGADNMSGFILYDGIKSTDEISEIFAQLAEMYEG